MVPACRLLCLVYIWLYVISLTTGLKLELASVLFRHGQRSPVAAFPNDSYQESYWPQGFGQLTTIGMKQQYYLGGLLRNRYVNTYNLINPNYTRMQVSIRSTDYDRTLMSAQAQLAAVFPPLGDQVFNESIRWQPIPVHTVPKEEDILLRAYHSDCQRYIDLRQADIVSDEYVSMENDNKVFFDRLSLHAGQPINLTAVWTFEDTLFVQNNTGLGLPSWVSNDDLSKLTALSTFTLGLMFNSKEKQRLTAGVWVKKVLDDLNAKVADPTQDMKLYLYSAHDTTVACMTTALGVYNGILPPYASTMFVELYSDNNGQYYVSLFLRNETYSDALHPLSIISCTNHTLCTLEEFSKLAMSVIPEDWEKECGTQSSDGGGSSATHIAVGVLSAMIVMLVVVVVVAYLLLYLHHRRLKVKYSPMRVRLTDAEGGEEGEEEGDSDEEQGEGTST